MLNSSRIMRIKLALLTAAALSGSTLFASCGLTDIRKNIVEGSLDFVEFYTEAILTGAAPTPPDVFPEDWPKD